MFYRENGKPHFRCDHCGAVDSMRWLTQSTETIKFVDGELECFSGWEDGVSDEWLECAECCAKYPDIDNLIDLRERFEKAEEIKDGDLR